jgi:hypothetical protein
MQFFQSTVCLVALTVCAFAAEPLPELKIEGADGGSTIHIKNVASQPLTAYQLELVDYPGSHFTSSVDLVDGPMAAGAERTYKESNMTIGASPDYVKVTAALFADGTSSGAEEKVANLIERRKTALRITRQLIARFEKAESGGVSKEAFSAELKQWADSERPVQKKQINAANASPAVAPVMIESARRQLDASTVKETLEHLRHYQQALAASKPALE